MSFVLEFGPILARYCQTCVPKSCVSLPLVPIYVLPFSCSLLVQLVPDVCLVYVPGVSSYSIYSVLCPMFAAGC